MLAESAKRDVGRAIQIDQVESHMLSLPQAECPVVHHFGPGIYIREVTLPAGTLAIGHAQKYDHLNIMITGSVAMVDEDGQTKVLVAPMIFVGKPGRKVGYVIETCVWQNVYPNPSDERDVDVLETKWLDKSQGWSDHDRASKESDYASHQADREDFFELIQVAGFTPDLVRQQSESEVDQIPMPEGWAPKFTIRNSSIEGRGVFLSSPAEPGEVIAPARIKGMRTPAGRYTNHSLSPNAQFVMDDAGDIFLVATKRISGCCGGGQGDEVTVDYRQALALSGIHITQGESK